MWVNILQRQRDTADCVSSGRLREIKKNWKFLTIIPKSGRLRGVVAYGRWLPTRGSIYSDLTWKLLVFWKSGR